MFIHLLSPTPDFVITSKYVRAVCNKKRNGTFDEIFREILCNTVHFQIHLLLHLHRPLHDMIPDFTPIKIFFVIFRIDELDFGDITVGIGNEQPVRFDDADRTGLRDDTIRLGDILTADETLAYDAHVGLFFDFPCDRVCYTLTRFDTSAGRRPIAFLFRIDDHHLALIKTIRVHGFNLLATKIPLALDVIVDDVQDLPRAIGQCRFDVHEMNYLNLSVRILDGSHFYRINTIHRNILFIFRMRVVAFDPALEVFTA